MRFTLRLFLVIVPILMAPTTVMAADAGHVLQLAGTADIVRSTGTVSLSTGALLQSGDRIRTGADSRVRIALEGGAVLTLGPESELMIPEQAARTVGVVDLVVGIVRAVLADEGTIGGFLVRGRTAVASVRSTDWIVETSEATTAVLSVSGDVLVSGSGGTVVLEPGEGTDVAAGMPPADPKEWGAERRNVAIVRTTMN